MSTSSDPVQHYLGWQSFRHTPLLQWPIGRNWNYGEKLATSVVFTDSVPLFALIFKPLNSVLPTQFQYFGMWILTCFVLQAIFAWALVRRFVDDRVIIALAAGLFVLTPAMLWRCWVHEALVGQWVLLAAFNVYFADRRKMAGWTAVLCVAALIHAYLLAMSIAVWATDALRLIACRLDSPRRVMKRTALNFAALLGTMWAVGYFYPGSTGAGGFGAFRFDLLSPINPETLWSVFYTGQTHGSDYEGFTYLGAGVILLIVVDLLLIVFAGKRIAVDRKHALPMMILAIGLLVFAMSNQVGVNGHIFTYPLPRFTTTLTSTFRASGRFAWPAVYLVVLAAIVFLARSVRRTAAIGVLGCLFLLQAVDLSKASEYFSSKWAVQWTSPFTSPFWTEAARQYDRVSVVPPTGLLDRSSQPAYFALAHGMSINDGEIIRINASTLEKERLRTVRIVETGRYDSSTLYVFPTHLLWDAAIKNARPGDFVGEVDGYRVYAPNWHGCIPTCGLRMASVEPYPNGKTTSFGVSGESDDFTVDGWSTIEATGRWTDGDSASLAIYVGKVTAPVRISFDFSAFATPARPQQTVEVLSSGKRIAVWTIGAAEVIRDVVIDEAEIDRDSGFAKVTFRFPDCISPQQMGVSEDNRQLGIFVRSMTVND